MSVVHASSHISATISPFLQARCIKSHIIPRDLRVQPPVPTKGARRVAELASKRFLRERIRLTQRAKGDAKRETESTAEGITATLTANEASVIFEKIRVNTQRVFNATKDQQQRKFLKLVQEKQASVSPHVDLTPRVDKNKWVINLSYYMAGSASGQDEANPAP